jgi:hypothetical protein
MGDWNWKKRRAFADVLLLRFPNHRVLARDLKRHVYAIVSPLWPSASFVSLLGHVF